MLRRRLMPWLLGACLLASGCDRDWGPDANGQAVSAAQLKGQWWVLNYWADWCGPCRREVPQLNALASEGVSVVGVNFDHLQGEALRHAASTLGIGFRVLAQDPAQRLGLPPSEGLPVTYLIGPDGTVRERRVGEQTAAGLKARLAALKGG
ncbi:MULTISPECIES: TlpA disulfide reductase family protein [unclassified Pseudomonas]|uniref:TlpA family protein disulfide reductase n=1 Tax=unclassified Pseudomonas TaxID=196821 RepID=UPI000BD7AD1C|nr:MULTISPECIES: TlpA disulfide reductase family protein [unclassified Pseudomonas]PVZ13876.1 thiol-disulfide isomerase/thioredoxin [Pseudomonas sp. URIL14HWK12:I12]PVZ24182.1 thiol-disulfide isomerase/thioredoxin [Pseudomonas sp. URIL14HWK12:I10]PVZ33179.1 thiol-disulfide isomerase/thioredoxin [Pseudomonas sp. URIL14HWK12:I11]SNZ10620.1 Thiol-disulfide isomerase or thioredoxin [Pseudomonas sp. URIL14HWK12:I9]